MSRIFKFLFGYLAISAVVAALWLLLSFPKHPTSVSGWLLFFAFALPVQIAMEFIGDVLWKNKAARFVEDRTSSKSFSWMRIGYGLLHIGVIFGVVLGVSFWLKNR